jgi:hypothetical protein
MLQLAIEQVTSNERISSLMEVEVEPAGENYFNSIFLSLNPNPEHVTT